jgi:GxxExxY protein
MKRPKIDLLYEDESYAIRGAAMEVHRLLGCGFLEAVYQQAMEIEFSQRGIPFVSQQEIPIHYKGHLLNKRYTADFVVFDKIIVEIKALDLLTTLEEAQILHYLKASGLKLGFLINFGAESLESKRMVWSK